MSAVVEELQFESEPQYNNEKLIPEAQLLEHPFDIINTLQQAASEGIVPQVADAISLAHLPNEGFKITHEINPNVPIEPNDGKAAIVAGICGVTKSCEDRCCPIGDLDKARVRVGLINELKLNDPDFFNNPNADKIIKDRVNEIMEQKQQLANTEVPISNTQSPVEQTDTPVKEVDTTVKEETKKKVEIPTGFFGRQLSPQEAEQRMKELSGTYSQGKKVSLQETDTTIPRQNIEAPTIETTQTTTIISSEQVVQNLQENKPNPTISIPPAEIIVVPIDTEQVQTSVSPITTEQRTPIHESISPTISQEQIQRHRPKIQQPDSKPSTSEPTEQVQPEIHTPKPIEQTVQLLNLQPIKELNPSFIMPAEIPIVPETIQFADIAVMTSQQIEPAITIPVDNVQSNKLVDLEQTITIPKIGTSVSIPQEIQYQSSIESIPPTTEKIVVTGQLEQLTERLTIQVDTVISNSNEFSAIDTQAILTEKIIEPTIIEKVDTAAIFQDQTTTSLFTYSERVQEPITQTVELPEATEKNLDIKNPIQTFANITDVQIDDLQISEQFLDDTNSVESITLVDSSESLPDGSNEIIQPATLETFTQVLTTLSSNQETVAEQNNFDEVVTDISPGQAEEQINDAIEHDVVFDLETPKNNVVEIPQYVDVVTFVESTSQDLTTAIESIIQKTETLPLIVLALPQLPEIITYPTEDILGTETTTERSGEQIDVVNLEETKTESFILYMLHQEQLVSFVHIIQQITDVLAFLHVSQNKNTEEFNKNIDIEVAGEELKNDTFGKYDDTVITMTLWPIVQFLLYIQQMQIFLPQKSQLTTVT